jgi:hypothetical protein
LVQSTEDGTFLAADGEGGCKFISRLTDADPFLEPESAVDAIEDHLDGHGQVIQVWVPVS